MFKLGKLILVFSLIYSFNIISSQKDELANLEKIIIKLENITETTFTDLPDISVDPKLLVLSYLGLQDFKHVSSFKSGEIENFHSYDFNFLQYPYLAFVKGNCLTLLNIINGQQSIIFNNIDPKVFGLNESNKVKVEQLNLCNSSGTFLVLDANISMCPSRFTYFLNKFEQKFFILFNFDLSKKNISVNTLILPNEKNISWRGVLLCNSRKRLAYQDGDKLKIYNVENLLKIKESLLDCSKDCCDIALSPCGKYYAEVNNRTCVSICDLNGNKIQLKSDLDSDRYRDHNISRLLFSNESKYLVGLSEFSESIYVWNINNLKEPIFYRQSIYCDTSSYGRNAFLRDYNLFYVDDKYVKVFNIDTKENFNLIHVGWDTTIQKISVSEDGNTIVLLVNTINRHPYSQEIKLNIYQNIMGRISAKLYRENI